MVLCNLLYIFQNKKKIILFFGSVFVCQSSLLLWLYLWSSFFVEYKKITKKVPGFITNIFHEVSKFYKKSEICWDFFYIHKSSLKSRMPEFMPEFMPELPQCWAWTL